MIKGSNLTEKRKNLERKYGESGKIQTQEYSIESFAREIGINEEILIDLENDKMSYEGLQYSCTPIMVARICLQYDIKPMDFFSGEEKNNEFYFSIDQCYDQEKEKRRKDIYLNNSKSNNDANNGKRIIKGVKIVAGVFGAVIFFLAAKEVNKPVEIYVNDDLVIGENDGSICNVAPNAVLIEKGHSRKINMGNGITEVEGCYSVYDGINDPKQKVWINKKYLRMIGKIQKMKIKDFRFVCKTEKESDSVYGITNGIVDQDGKMQMYYIDGANTLTFDKLPADLIEILQNEGQLVLPSNERLQGVLVNPDGEKMKTSIGSGTTIVSDRTVNNAPISSFKILDEEQDGKLDGTFSTEGESVVYNAETNTFGLEEK